VEEYSLVLLPLLRSILDDLPALTNWLAIEPHLDAVDVVINTTPATNEMLGNTNAGEEIDSHFCFSYYRTGTRRDAEQSHSGVS
jgi:hypothetical protein